MKLNTRDNRFLVSIIGFYLLSVLIYFLGPTWINSLFTHEKFKLLNFLANTETNQSLSFYLGVIEENWTGPLRFLCSGLSFLLFSLCFLTRSSLRMFLGAVFGYLLLSRPEVLFFPPYGDPISGPWAEALWLAQNNFNYVDLYRQPEYAMGGPKVYLFTLYPTYLALLMKLIPSTKLFLCVNHLFVFGMAAATVALFRETARKVFSEATATLVGLLLLFLPLFQAGSELLNMEMPSTFFAVWTFYALSRKHFGRALLFGILAMLMKAPGLIALLTVAVAAGIWALLHQPYRVKNFFISILSLGFAYGFVYIKKFVNPNPLPHNAIKFLAGWPHLIHCPVIRWSLGLSAGCLLLLFICHRNKKRLEYFWIPLIALTLALAWFALYLNFSVLGPRYKLILAPFLLFAVTYCVHAVIRNEKIIRALSIFLLCSMMFCVYGAHYKKRIESKPYAYGLIERSLEYRNDLKLYRKIAQTLKTEFPGFAVGAPFIVAQSLAIPRLGYVQKPLDVTLYGMSVFYAEHIRNFNGIDKMNALKTVWIGFRNETAMGFPYPRDPGEKIIQTIEAGDKKVFLFYGGAAVDRTYKLILLKQMGRL